MSSSNYTKINSKSIILKIFEHIKKNKILRIIKYNRKLMNIFDVDISDVTSMYYINQINFEFKTKIEDHFIEDISINNNTNKNNCILDYLYCIKFKNLKNLNLDNNSIIINNNSFGCDNLFHLNNIYTPVLEKISLRLNLIYSIEFLTNNYFNKLKELDLSFNLIQSISVLQNVNLPNLKILNLSNNLIADIKYLNWLNSKKLEILNLNNNKINIYSLSTKYVFPLLNELYLSKNLLDNIFLIKTLNLNQFKKIDLSYNNIRAFDFIRFINTFFNEYI